MKILKKVAIFLILFFLVFLLITAFLPKTVHVERSISIDAPATLIYNQVNILKNWSAWSPWEKIDTTTVMTYNDKPEGVGASYSWDSKNPNVGKGTLTVMAVKPNAYIQTQMDFGEMGISTAAFKFTPSKKNTTVVWSFDSPLGFFSRLFPGLFMETFLGPDYEKGLASLKAVAERNYQSFHVVQLPAISALTITKAGPPKSIGTMLGEGYMEIGKAAGKSAKVTGPVFALYDTYNADNVQLRAAVPFSPDVKSASTTVQRLTLPAREYLEFNYYGTYENLHQVYADFPAVIAFKGLQSDGPPLEIYVTDPGLEKDSRKWLTKIQFPVK